MENKKYIKHIVFAISLLPYAILLYMCICYAIGGYRHPGEEEIIYGFDAIGNLLSNVFFMWFITFASLPYSLPIVLIICLWIGYQIYYLITLKNSKSKIEIESENKNTIKNTNFSKLLFYMAIIGWCLCLAQGIPIFFTSIVTGKRNIRFIRIYIKLVCICIYDYSNITNFINIYCYLSNSKQEAVEIHGIIFANAKQLREILSSEYNLP